MNKSGVLTCLFLILPALGLLAGCVSLEQIHQSCYRQTNSFAAQVQCINNQIAQENSLGNDSYVQEYQQTATVLKDRLAQGEITENEARLLLTRKLNEIGQEQLRTQALMNQAFERPYPVFTDCYRVNGDITCRSY